MFDIYEALKSGQTPDEIAQKFVDEMNAAIQKQEADKAAAAAASAQKEKDTSNLIEHINAYLHLYYPTVDPMTVEEFIATIEGAIELKGLIDDAIENPPTEDEFQAVMQKFFDQLDI